MACLVWVRRSRSLYSGNRHGSRLCRAFWHHALERDRESEMQDLFDNPMGLMGFEFVEFASPTPRTPP